MPAHSHGAGMAVTCGRGYFLATDAVLGSSHEIISRLYWTFRQRRSSPTDTTTRLTRMPCTVLPPHDTSFRQNVQYAAGQASQEEPRTASAAMSRPLPRTCRLCRQVGTLAWVPRGHQVWALRKCAMLRNVVRIWRAVRLRKTPSPGGFER